ncbi:MAG: HNH endonuclease signature motif containing protein [Gemmatimonadota bacterium]
MAKPGRRYLSGHNPNKHRRLPIEQRIAAYTVEAGECLEWTGPRNYSGYGYMKIGARNVRAHRIVWESAHGPIPTGLFVLHSCDNRWCVRLAHLRLGSHVENMTDLRNRGRGRTSDKRGERNPAARLDEWMVREMRAAHEKGVSLHSLAVLTGLDMGQVAAIIGRRAWVHV